MARRAASIRSVESVMRSGPMAPARTARLCGERVFFTAALIHSVGRKPMGTSSVVTLWAEASDANMTAAMKAGETRRSVLMPVHRAGWMGRQDQCRERGNYDPGLWREHKAD